VAPIFFFSNCFDRQEGDLALPSLDRDLPATESGKSFLNSWCCHFGSRNSVGVTRMYALPSKASGLDNFAFRTRSVSPAPNMLQLKVMFSNTGNPPLASVHAFVLDPFSGNPTGEQPASIAPHRPSAVPAIQKLLPLLSPASQNLFEPIRLCCLCVGVKRSAGLARGAVLLDGFKGRD